MKFKSTLLIPLLLLCVIVPARSGETPLLPISDYEGTKSQWEGYDRYDFTFQERNAVCVVPSKVAAGNPWIWRPAFFGAFASVDEALLEAGYHVLYYDLTHLYGSPRAVELGTNFYEHVVDRYHLSDKVTVEGFSRGGLCVFQWAAQHADKVACIYVDAPVCDVRSWPGRKRPALWHDLLTEWQIQDSLVTDSFRGNVMNVLRPLAEAHIPIISVCGTADTVVPYDKNMHKVRMAYQAMGGVVETILKPGIGHHPHSLENPKAIVDFITRHQPGELQKSILHQRGNLDNAFGKFTHEKRGCVAFLGGSITEMKGWRNLIQEKLRQQFPDTQFTFIDAGLSSTGSTPHAFRLESDVLQHGMPDLLFVEAAVNDDTNHFTAQEQVRGMEGIIRHLRRTNPLMDMIMLHFPYDPFLPLHQQGEQPDVILNHERVANRYHISSINIAQEIAERIKHGELTWQQYGGTHPVPEGHKYLATAINQLLDANLKPEEAYRIQAHPVPVPLDRFSYDRGAFLKIEEATHLKGFRYESSWTPKDRTIQTKVGFEDDLKKTAGRKIETRPNFVNVPMLTAEQAGASLRLSFVGRAIGIFCVAGPHAAVLAYSIDGAPYQQVDTYTEWSHYLYIPWVYMFATELTEGPHTLRLRVVKGDKTECQIRNFVVNH